jgi:hypothetical protein
VRTRQVFSKGELRLAMLLPVIVCFMPPSDRLSGKQEYDEQNEEDQG